MFFGSNCISWSAKKQPMVSQSSSKAEYLSMAIDALNTFLLRDKGIRLSTPPMLLCDHLSALYLTTK